MDQLAEAQRLKDSGKLDAAESICQKLLLNGPKNAGALHLLGVILHLRGRQDDAIKSLQAAVQIEPNNAGYLVTLGGNLAIAGRMDDATECFQKAVHADPASVEARYNLGLAFKHRKEFADAETCFSAVLLLAPMHVDAIANLGIAVSNLGRAEEAKLILSQALTLSPAHPLSLTTLATIFVNEGKREQAEAILRAFEPEASEASLFRLASVYDQIQNNRLTISSLRYWVEKYPGSAEAHATLATALIGDLQIAEGIKIGRKAISLDSKNPAAWCSLAMALEYNGEYDEAYEAFTRAMKLSSALGPRVKRELMLPSIMGTREEVQKSRQVFERNLDRLISENLRSEDPLHEIGFTYFFLAYHGENDLPLQRKIAEFYQKIAPSLNFIAPHCCSDRSAREKDKRIRVGFYSHFVSTHSVSVAFAKVLEGLSGVNKFEIQLITDSSVADAGVSTMYPSLRNRVVQTPRSLNSAQQVVASLELDILVYLDMGMDPLTFLLGFSRLAPIQCVMTGHPVTTGIPTIDYFFSGELTETQDAQSHYSEKLIRFKHVGFEFQRLEMPVTIKARDELQLPLSRNVYLCPMMLQKIHPDFDEAVEKILQQDRNGCVVFFESAQSPEWGRRLRKRFERTIDKSLLDRVLFIPWILDQKDFLCVIAQSNVVLDPFHFGIGTTSMYLCTTGTPFVTKPSLYTRGRAGYAYCKLLEIPECIASDVDSYVSTAIRIANDSELRATLKARILQNSHRIFESADAAQELAETLNQLSEIHL
jgi:predicted O-linked N-acetylglucosamine transferase (SPINDLY family)